MTRAADTARLLGAGGSILGSLDVGGGQIGGRRNIAINGAMQVAQRGTTTGQGNASAYSAVDRMNIHGGSTAGRLTSSQDSDSPVFLGNSLKLACTTADTSVAAGEFLLLEQKLEGQDLQQLEFNQSSAKATTVSFYVKGNAAAQYTFALQYHLSGGTARWFTKGFAVTTDWVRITITIPGDTQASSGSDYGIADNNATGANLIIWLHGGTNFSSGTHQDTAWADRVYTTLLQDNQTSFYDSTNRTFFFTGFQFEVGSVATQFEHMSFGEQLGLCQRYFQQSYVHGTAAGTANTDVGRVIRFADAQQSYAGHWITFKTEMRAAPTGNVYNTVTGNADSIRDDNGNHNADVSGAATHGMHVYANNSAIGASEGVKAQFTADAEI